MEGPPQKSPPTPPWKVGLIFGFPVGVGFAAGKIADDALLGPFGYWGAFAASILVAGVVAVVFGIATYRLIR